MNQTSDPNEQRTLGYIEGRMEGLATKDFVRETVQTAINNQTERLDERFDKLEEEIKGAKNTQTKAIGVAVGIGFVLSLVIGAGNLAVNLGWIQTL